MVQLLEQLHDDQNPTLRNLTTAIRTAIVLGEFPPDMRLDEHWLAEQFRVTRLEIREVFPILERNGLIYRQANRGVYVIGFDENDIREIYEYRMMIELYALRKILTLPVRPNLQPLYDLMRQAQQLTQQEQYNLQAFTIIDLNFHRSIVELAGNKRILNAWDGKIDLIQVFISVVHDVFAEQVSQEVPPPIDHHKIMLELLAEGNTQQVIEVFTEHLIHSQELTQTAIAIMCKRRNGS